MRRILGGGGEDAFGVVVVLGKGAHVGYGDGEVGDGVGAAFEAAGVDEGVAEGHDV